MDETFPDFRTSPVLTRNGFRHAFFTRRGGVSGGPYASLNFSIAVGDTKENVERNLALAARALSVPVGAVHFLSQVHGAAVYVVTRADDRTATLHREGDAIASSDPEIAVAVRIADCVPILVGDSKSGAAVAIHAGWRGLVAGVVESGVAALRELAGDRGALVAAIGPHIGVRAFEVSEDVAGTLGALEPDADAVERQHGPKPHVSLARIARRKLERLGLREDSIDLVPGCTHDEPELFYSFRRDGKVGGRHLAAIVPRGPR
ncbi:MAG TPA: peptidoglycan editing factor PgeF [Polyangiaceae bacterium]|nr:peptidoglycan editing factor PgeF [Polyangiaceae bacterium]